MCTMLFNPFYTRRFSLPRKSEAKAGLTAGYEDQICHGLTVDPERDSGKCVFYTHTNYMSSRQSVLH
jgi:hypothetical protein